MLPIEFIVTWIGVIRHAEGGERRYHDAGRWIGKNLCADQRMRVGKPGATRSPTLAQLGLDSANRPDGFGWASFMPNVGTERVPASPLSVTPWDRLRVREQCGHRINPTLRFRQCHEVLPVLAFISRIEVETLVAGRHHTRHVFAVLVELHCRCGGPNGKGSASLPCMPVIHVCQVFKEARSEFTKNRRWSFLQSTGLGSSICDRRPSVRRSPSSIRFNVPTSCWPSAARTISWWSALDGSAGAWRVSRRSRHGPAGAGRMSSAQTPATTRSPSWRRGEGFLARLRINN